MTGLHKTLELDIYEEISSWNYLADITTHGIPLLYKG